MANYKILETRINEDVSTSILNKDTGIICPKCTGNKEYDQFLQDVKEHGLGIVEGPDITTESYVTLREKEYPSIEEQLDKIYHSTLTAWKAEIKAIKDKYPKTITGGSTGGNAAPAWVQTEVDKLNS
tara:strand:+ start:1447 stop:1827 length:381 start_codon:yes stop_codon:yes gene_type:complete